MESGRLEDESTASLCRRLAAESRTGCLHLIGEGADDRSESRIYLREGRVHTAVAPASRARLGDRLLGGGHLTPEQLEMALVLQREGPPDTRLGDALVSSGLVPRELLRRVIRDQVVDAITVALAWTSGAWRFADGESVPADTPLGLGMQDTLMEAARRLGQIEVIQAHMGSMDTVVDFASGGPESRLSLQPDEWAMLTHIDGVASVAEIAERAGYTQLDAARIIYGLLCAGVLIRVGVDDQAPTPAPPAAPPTSAAGDSYLDELEGLGSAAGTFVPVAPAAPPADPPAAAPAPPAGAADDPVSPAEQPSPGSGWSTPATSTPGRRGRFRRR